MRWKPGARVGTFTVAGAVRRGLQSAGFEVAKAEGFGRKRERLEARLPGEARDAPRTTAAVLGAGVAGASLARALNSLGASVVVLDAKGAAAGASGNPAALVSAALDAGGGTRAAFYAQTLARARDLYAGTPGVTLSEGLVQLERAERDGQRFDAVAASGVFDPARITRIDAAAASAEIGSDLPSGGLQLVDALTIDPKAAIDHWLRAATLVVGQAAKLERADGRWRVLASDGALLAEADVLCLAAGYAISKLWPALPMQPVRGQASWARAEGPAKALAWGGYATPFGDHVLFGATHDRDREDIDVTPADHARNLKTLAEVLPQIASRLNLDALDGRAGVRAATPDRMPMAGALGAEGLYVLGGLGSRGFSTAPLLAEHIAALICGAPSPLPADVQRIIDPMRFTRTRSP